MNFIIKTLIITFLILNKCNPNKDSKNSKNSNDEYLTKSQIKELIVKSLLSSNISPDNEANNKIIKNIMKDVPERVHESELDKYVSTQKFIKVIEDLFKHEMGEEKFNKFKNHLQKLEEKNKKQDSKVEDMNRVDKGENIEL